MWFCYSILTDKNVTSLFVTAAFSLYSRNIEGQTRLVRSLCSSIHSQYFGHDRGRNLFVGNQMLTTVIFSAILFKQDSLLLMDDRRIPKPVDIEPERRSSPPQRAFMDGTWKRS